MAALFEAIAAHGMYALQYFAQIFPAVILYVSGLLSCLSLSSDESGTFIAAIAIFAMSACVSALAYMPIFHEANFKLMVLMLAGLSAVRLYLDPVRDERFPEKLNLYFWQFIMMSSTLAAVLAMGYRRPSRRIRDTDLPIVERYSSGSSELSRQSTGFAEMAQDEAWTDSHEIRPSVRSLQFKHMSGPKLAPPSLSNSSGSSLSLSSRRGRVDNPFFLKMARWLAEAQLPAVSGSGRHTSTVTHIGDDVSPEEADQELSIPGQLDMRSQGSSTEPWDSC